MMEQEVKEKNLVTKRVVIDDKYFMDIDRFNYTLKKRAGFNKAGKEKNTLLGYFSSMDFLLKKLMKMYMIDNLEKVGTLEEMKQTIDKSKEYINNVCIKLGL